MYAEEGHGPRTCADKQKDAGRPAGLSKHCIPQRKEAEDLQKRGTARSSARLRTENGRLARPA